jgi:D-amino-acid dehydrogenase
MKVCVLGAGVAGMTSAYFLARDGHEVTVVERNAGVGLETSYANGGQLSYSYVAPLAGPGVLPKVPPWLMKRDAPLRFSPRLDYYQWRFCLQFVLACTAAQSELTTSRLLRLSFYSRALMHAMVAGEALDFDYVRNGKLVFYSDAAAYRGALEMMEYQKSLGCEQQALDRAGCVALEPALTHIAPEIAGGIYTQSEDAGDCYRFCTSLERVLRGGAHPVKFEFNTRVTGFVRAGSSIAAVQTDRDAIAADVFVVTLGAQSVFLLRPIGIDAPIYPLKGYSLTLPIANATAAPFVSITDHKRKVVYARLGEELRVAGMADITNYRAELDCARIDVLVREVKDTFPGSADFGRVKPWCGLRPATPKGTPVIGHTQYSNLLLNIGHGALGFTLACGCGKITADLAAGRDAEISLDGLTLNY